ncbi:hypothetical protein PV328_006910 [Microctonus aethiopoides]|uniref:Mesoderm induction early response protein 1 n=1 Tax=Microctonus aethiopoides TaxID=144406 RepID=A0AA39FQ48_9HYME|nr:hypothetical protein PV328_006910 [Microctonus aethiopoides]
MLQDSRTARTAASSGAGAGNVGRTLTRRMTGNGCSRRSERTYNMGPTSDLIVNDFDDERTLDEEEAMEGSEDSHNELSNLQKEGDMPLKELLAKYGYSHTSTENSNSSDQLVLIRDGGEPESNVNPAERVGENDPDDFEDEEEEDDDEDDGEDDDDDDDDDEDGTGRRKVGSKSQPSLRQFYAEMVRKKAAESMTADAGVKSSNTHQSRASGDRRRDGDVFDMSYSGVGNDRIGGLYGGNNADNPASGEAGSGGGNNTRNVGADGEGINVSGRPGDEDEDDDDDDDDEDDDEDAGVTGEAGVNSVGSGNVGGGSSRLLRSVSRPQSEEEDDDCDYSPDEEEWKKTIMVGSDYQATIPEGLCRYDDALPYENEDKILWNPTFIPEGETEEFLDRAQLHTTKSNSLPAGNHVRDDEQALYLLLQCGYNLEEALRRRRMNVLPPTDAISLWSEEECHNFESGLRTYGKDFHLIQKNKVRTRSVGELVQFYYLWKKTERHDIFTYKARLEKKKYALHPGITRDYMDRFLEEQEGVRDRSSSPNVNCLIHGDAKRQRTAVNMANNHSESGKSTESWDGAMSEDPLGELSNTEAASTTITSPPSSLLPPLAPPPPPPPPLLIPSSSSSLTPPTSSSTSLSVSSTMAQINSSPIASQNLESTTHDYSPMSDNVLTHLPP